jgi:hypothetical protein
MQKLNQLSDFFLSKKTLFLFSIFLNINFICNANNLISNSDFICFFYNNTNYKIGSIIISYEDIKINNIPDKNIKLLMRYFDFYNIVITKQEYNLLRNYILNEKSATKIKVFKLELMRFRYFEINYYEQKRNFIYQFFFKNEYSFIEDLLDYSIKNNFHNTFICYLKMVKLNMK